MIAQYSCNHTTVTSEHKLQYNKETTMITSAPLPPGDNMDLHGFVPVLPSTPDYFQLEVRN